MYTQFCVALLCAMNNCMATGTLVRLTRRVGEVCLRFWSGKKKEFCQRGVREYAIGVSQIVWGGPENDRILQTFFNGGGGGRSSAAGAGRPKKKGCHVQ